MFKFPILNATNKSIEAVLSGAITTTQPDFATSYADITASSFTEIPNDGTLNSTTPVTIVAAPAASTRRIVKSFIIFNRDTVNITVTLSYNNAGTLRKIGIAVVEPDGYVTEEGVYGANGIKKADIISIDYTQINNFAEAVDDQVSGLLAVEDGLDINYNDAGDTLTMYNTSINAGGRLTVTSGDPIGVDNSGYTHIYYTPYVHDKIKLWDGTRSRLYTFPELDLDLAGGISTRMYDIFVYLDSGAPAIEKLAWTNNTTRATGLTMTDGYLHKSGDQTRHYVGSYRNGVTTATCDDLRGSRGLWNNYNRVLKELFVQETTDSWTYSTPTWRPWNNSSANKVEWAVGLNEDVISLYFMGGCSVAAAAGVLALGIDSTTAVDANCFYGRYGAATLQSIIVWYHYRPGIGFHYAQALEYASSATVTFYGDPSALLRSGISGFVKC